MAEKVTFTNGNSTIIKLVADDGIITDGNRINKTSDKLQTASDKVNILLTGGELDEAKSVHFNFTNRKIHYLPAVINQQMISIRQQCKVPRHDSTRHGKLENTC